MSTRPFLLFARALSPYTFVLGPRVKIDQIKDVNINESPFPLYWHDKVDLLRRKLLITGAEMTLDLSFIFNLPLLSLLQF